MATVQTQIRIEEDVKKQAVELFNQLGIDMSGAVNMFLGRLSCVEDFLLAWKFLNSGRK